MKKLLMLALIGLSSSVIAATQGTSTLKLSNSDPDNTLRTARVALDHVNADIAELDQKISETRAQALAARAVPAANRSAGASLEALANAMELERAQLTAKRESLRTDLQYESN